MSQVDDDNRRIVLASGSPRRLQLMEQLGFEPVVISSDIPEQRGADESPTDYTRRLAQAKAEDVARSLEASDAPDWVLAADTIVILDGDVLEKPVDAQEAAQMLGRMSGRDHVVETSLCWLQRSTGRKAVRSVTARVTFRELSAETIERYVATGEPFDKAGAYGIQDMASAFVRSVEGSHFAIVGLPVCETIEVLDNLGGLAGFPFVDADSNRPGGADTNG
jgi:septum formation protein